MDQYQIWNHKYNGRFYEIYLHKDFFDWVINLAWGSVRKKPRSKTLLFETFSDASTELKNQQKLRIAHNYILTKECSSAKSK